MEILEKLLAALPKNKLKRSADFKIKFQLYRIIYLKRLKDTFNFFSWNFVVQRRYLALGLFILLIFGTTSVYAYASNNVAPGNKLYPLKIAIEKIEQTVAVSSSAKIANYKKLSTRRLQEAVVLSKENINSKQTENIKNNIDSEVNNHTAIVNHINNLKDAKKTATLIEQAKNNDQEEINYLDKIGEYAKNNQNEEVLQKVNEAKKVISDQKYKDLSESIQNEEVNQIKSRSTELKILSDFNQESKNKIENSSRRGDYTNNQSQNKYEGSEEAGDENHSNNKNKSNSD